MIEQYLKKVFNTAASGDVAEGSYYSSIEWLFEAYGSSLGLRNVTAKSLTKKTEVGFPDIRVKQGTQSIIGYVEVKDPKKFPDLLRLPASDKQRFAKYRAAFPNVILTNAIEFWLYRDGNRILEALLTEPKSIFGKTAGLLPEGEASLDYLLRKFFVFSIPSPYTARTLASALAKRTRFLRDEIIAEELREQKQAEYGDILNFYEAFRKTLISTLSLEQFADLFSQTITYGLLAARYRAKRSGFDRRLAIDGIPKTIGVLRDVFRYISSGDLPVEMEWAIDDIAEVLATADVHKIFDKYYKEGTGRDPLFYFYETFLSEYDPAEKEQRGVFYTPEPVVGYICRSVNRLLKERFEKPLGIGDSEVTVLDPAAGTLTFYAVATTYGIREYVAVHGSGGKKDFIKKHILANFFAFELMMAPYVIGHLKMAFLLDEQGYQLGDDERIKFYLTNTLEMREEASGEIESTIFDPVIRSITEESDIANKVKKEQPIVAVIGNPPYFGESANPSIEMVEVERGQEYIPAHSKPSIEFDEKANEYVLRYSKSVAKKKKKVLVRNWIGQQIDHYKIDEGHWLDERTAKWIQDDYVKFIRFGQWKIEQAGEGILGFITNHGYIDNPTFRGLRQSLMRTFDTIYILDLHGNARKKEVCPDGSKDENVFDIRPGVAIALFVKKRKRGSGKCQVFHSEIWGLRQEKYDWLVDNDFASTKWKKVRPLTPHYYFVPRAEKDAKRWADLRYLPEIFGTFGVGMTTARDAFVVDTDRTDLVERLRRFRDSRESDESLHRDFNISKKKGWSIRNAWQSLQSLSDDDIDNLIVPVLYRPFDVRWIVYHDAVVWRTARRVMSNMVNLQNIGLCVGRQWETVGSSTYDVCFTSEWVTDFNLFRRGGGCLFPLYVDQSGETSSNLAPSFISEFEESLGVSISPMEAFSYIYATLFSTAYRTRYSDFLKRDFPRIPIISDVEIFKSVSKCGGRLLDLHTLKAKELFPPVARYEGERVTDPHEIEKIEYKSNDGYIFINDDQYFTGVKRDVWEYHIGGYQICDKWLRDRKHLRHALSAPGDTDQYCKIVTAIELTTETQNEIDDLFSKIE